MILNFLVVMLKRKSKKKQVTLILIIYFTCYVQLLAIQCVINIQITSEISYIAFFIISLQNPTRIFTHTAHLTSDQPHFQCPVATCIFLSPTDEPSSQRTDGQRPDGLIQAVKLNGARLHSQL